MKAFLEKILKINKVFQVIRKIESIRDGRVTFGDESKVFVNYDTIKFPIYPDAKSLPEFDMMVGFNPDGSCAHFDSENAFIRWMDRSSSVFGMKSDELIHVLTQITECRNRYAAAMNRLERIISKQISTVEFRTTIRYKFANLSIGSFEKEVRILTKSLSSSEIHDYVNMILGKIYMEDIMKT